MMKTEMTATSNVRQVDGCVFRKKAADLYCPVSAECNTGVNETLLEMVMNSSKEIMKTAATLR